MDRTYIARIFLKYLIPLIWMERGKILLLVFAVGLGKCYQLSAMEPVGIVGKNESFINKYSLIGYEYRISLPQGEITNTNFSRERQSKDK
jgi:hypothetical protein